MDCSVSLEPRSPTDSTHRTSLHDVRLRVTDVGVGEGLHTTVGNGKTTEEERHLDDELENVREGKESEVDIVRGEELIKQEPDGTDSGDDISVSQKNTLGSTSCSRQPRHKHVDLLEPEVYMQQ